jgi:hypothetical protein
MLQLVKFKAKKAVSAIKLFVSTMLIYAFLPAVSRASASLIYPASVSQPTPMTRCWESAHQTALLPFTENQCLEAPPLEIRSRGLMPVP